jgi:hypothetical protein
MSVLSFEQERERIFERWLSRVGRLLDRHLDREAAFEAWTNGYSVREYAAELTARETGRPFI